MIERLAATSGSESCDALSTVAAKRLVLFAPNLAGGGAERTLARLATHWVEQNRDVTLVTLGAPSSVDFPLPPAVRRVGLGLTNDSRGPLAGVRNNLRRIRSIRATFREARPDIVVSFIEQTNVLALLAARPLGVPVVVSERTDPSRHRVGRLWNWLRRKTYPRSAALVVLTEEIADFMRPVAAGRPVVVIPNGVAGPAVPRVPEEQRSERTVLGVGRLSREKGFDVLVRTFALAAVDHPQWRLVLLGDGPERASLEALAAEHGIAERVELPGRVVDPDGWYARADLFALPSRYEGFPNALLEAMSHGVPAVAFGGPSSVRRIIRDGTDGLIVPDGQSVGFWEAIRTLIEDDERRLRMGKAAREVATRFSLDAFFTRWDAVLEAAASGDFSQLLQGSGE